MSYEVLARKWRPKQFDEVVGQGHVTQTLVNAIQSGRLAHAYLFVGPRGVGKTSIARILAKALDCEKGPTPKPCDTCSACSEIASGTHLDVMEIDGASNNGVDQVRDLRESVRYAPARAPYKIYIIDEVHMLTGPAFNALLKTLEEPPAHAKFIFATTEPQKLPATILSRCQRFDLRRISTRDIVAHLSKIAAAEKIKIDDAALLAVARGAEGGLRDAESALDQLVAFCGRAIAEADVLSVFGLVAWKKLQDLVDALLKGDISCMFRLVAELDAAGKDLQRLALEVLEYLRDLLVVIYAGDLADDGETTDLQLEVLRRQAKGIEPARLARMVDVLLEAQGQVRHALSRRTVLEVALVRAARAASVASLDDVLALLAGMGGTGALPVEGAVPAPVRAPAPAVRPTAASDEAPPATGASVSELDNVRARWAELVERAGAAAPLARGYLKDGFPAAVAGDRLTIGFDPEYSASCSKMSAPRCVRAIQKALEDVLHRSMSVDLKVMAAPPGWQALPAAGPKAEGNQADAPAAQGGSRAAWVKDPAVKKALEAFSGDIVDIRE